MAEFQQVEVPGQGQFEFPIGMSDDDISEALKGFMRVAESPKPTHPSLDVDLYSQETDLSNVGDTFRNFMISEEGWHNGTYKDAVGNQTIGIGHKLKKDELKAGKITLGDEKIDYSKGLTDEQVDRLFEQDVMPFMNDAQDMIRQGGLEHVPNISAAVTSLLFNYGVPAFRKTKAHRNLIRGDLAGFQHEAFDAQAGIVYAGGKPILRNRRRAELELMNPNRGIERTQMGPFAETEESTGEGET